MNDMEGLVRIANSSIIAAIDPNGAELVELSIIDGENVLWEKDGVFWNRIAPNLFPIVGRLKKDTYTIDGKQFSMSQHGFARDRKFSVESRSEEAVTLLLSSDQETLKIYPFSFEFRVIYTLQDSGIHVQYSVKNTGDGEMPYSVGGHPGFGLSDEFSNYELRFPAPLRIERHLLEGSYFSGKTETMKIEGKLPLSYELFQRDAIVFIKPPFNTLTLAHKVKGPVLTVSSDQWDALGIWTKKGAPFLCIEPWWGFADRLDTSGDLFEKAGIHILETNKQEITGFSITIA